MVILPHQFRLTHKKYPNFINLQTRWKQYFFSTFDYPEYRLQHLGNSFNHLEYFSPVQPPYWYFIIIQSVTMASKTSKTNFRRFTTPHIRFLYFNNNIKQIQVAIPLVFAAVSKTTPKWLLWFSGFLHCAAENRIYRCALFKAAGH